MGLQLQWGDDDISDGSFEDPSGIAVDPLTDDIFITDFENNRVQRFSSDGTFEMKWGTQGSAPGQFHGPSGVAVVGDSVYVGDAINHRIQKFDRNGVFQSQFGNGHFSLISDVAANSSFVYVTDSGSSAAETFTTAGVFVARWGLPGAFNPPSLSGPNGVAVGPDGTIYVADTGNARVRRYSPDDGDAGADPQYLGDVGGSATFHDPGDVAVAVDGLWVSELEDGYVNKVNATTGAPLSSVGSPGLENGQLSGPRVLALDAAGFVHVADQSKSIQQFNPAVGFVRRIGFPNGGLPGQIRVASAIAIAPDNDVYMTDSEIGRVQRFSADGSFELQWGSPGTSNSHFRQPCGIAVNDANDRVFVADCLNNRVQVFDTSGAFITKFGSGPGNGNGDFNFPAAIAVSPSSGGGPQLGRVYVVDTANDRIQRFNQAGVFEAAFGTEGSDPGELNGPTSIAIDSSGNIYVYDSQNLRIEKFDGNGAFLDEWVPSPMEDGSTGGGGKLAVDADGNVYMSDGHSKIQKFTSTGDFLGVAVDRGSYSAILSAFALNRTTGQAYVGAGSEMFRFLGPAGGFNSVAPKRILDTRNGTGGLGVFGSGQTQALDVTATGGSDVPATGVGAVVLSVTATAPTANGWLTLFPAGDLLPTSSNLNFLAGQTTSNLVVVKVGQHGTDEGKVSINNSGGSPNAGFVHVVIDVVGWFENGADTGVHDGASRFVGVTPERVLDTRTGVGMPGGQAARVAPGVAGAVSLDLDAVAPIMGTNATAVVLNVTATAPTKSGWVTVYPSDASLPTASNLNFLPGETVPNLVTVGLGFSDGAVKLANTSFTTPVPGAGSVDLIADVVGYYYPTADDPGLLGSFKPQRILDTRFGTGVPGDAVGPVGPNGEVIVDPHFALGVVPATGHYAAVIVNVTVTGPTKGGWITVFPSDSPLPLASNLNFVTGQTEANLVMVKVGADGKFKLSNTDIPGPLRPSSGSVHVIVDLLGYYE